MLLASLKASIVASGGFAGCMLLLAGAATLRMAALVNRASIVRDFGSGSVFLLAARYLRWTWEKAVSGLHVASVCDVLSFALLVSALARLVWAVFKDPDVDGEGFW